MDEVGDVLEHLGHGRRRENRGDELLEAYPRFGAIIDERVIALRGAGGFAFPWQ